MLIVKSFYRKKTTKIYIILILLISLGFTVLLNLKQYYVNLLNENYDGSILLFEISNDKDLKNIKNIKDYYKSIIIEHNDLNPILAIENLNIPDNEVIIHTDLKETYKIGEILSFDYNDNNIELKLNDYYDSDYNIKPFLINNNTFNIINDGAQQTVYIANLKNWFLREKTIQELESKLNISVTLLISKKDNINYDNTIYMINIFIMSIFILFIITSIILLFNMISDEKQIHELYKNIGFSKLQICKTIFIKIGIMIIFATIPLIILTIIYLS